MDGKGKAETIEGVNRNRGHVQEAWVVVNEISKFNSDYASIIR